MKHYNVFDLAGFSHLRVINEFKIYHRYTKIKNKINIIIKIIIMSELSTILIASFIYISSRFLLHQPFIITNSLIIFSNAEILLCAGMYLRNINFLPQHYQSASKIMFATIEAISNLIFFEVFVGKVWTRLKLAIEFGLKMILMDYKLNLYEEIGGNNLLAWLIVSIASFFLIYTLLATKNSEVLSQVINNYRQSIQEHLKVSSKSSSKNENIKIVNLN